MSKVKNVIFSFTIVCLGAFAALAMEEDQEVHGDNVESNEQKGKEGQQVPTGATTQNDDPSSKTEHKDHDDKKSQKGTKGCCTLF